MKFDDTERAEVCRLGMRPEDLAENLYCEAWHRLKSRPVGKGTWSGARLRKLMAEVWEEVTDEAVARREGGTNRHGAG